MFSKKKSDNKKSTLLTTSTSKPKVEEKKVASPIVPVDEKIGLMKEMLKYLKPKKIIREVYIPCPECRSDVKGNLLDCPHCKNTRKKLKEWIEEREVQ
jgi:flavoprotein